MLLDELFELLFELRLDGPWLLDACRVGVSLLRPTARAARFMPLSQPRKKPCTAVSPRGLLRLLLELEFVLLLLDELTLLLLDELELLFELLLLDELDDEFDEELLEELDEELLDELEPPRPGPPPKPPLRPEPPEAELPPRDPPDEPLELLLELLLPALMVSGFTLSSTSCAMAANPLTVPRSCACAPLPPTTPATAVTITPSCCFMENLFTLGLAHIRTHGTRHGPGLM